MMFNVMNLPPKRALKLVRQSGADGRAFALIAQSIHQHGEVGPIAHDKGYLPNQIRLGILINGDGVDTLDIGACLFEAPRNRLGWKASPMLLSPESLFLGGGDERAILYHTSGGIAVIGVDT
jgi:hypothetical protein